MSKLGELANVRFGVFTETEIRALSQVLVSEQYVRGGSSQNTPYDPRLGTMDKKSLCVVCSEDYKTCVGHFGHIELDEPVLNPSHFNITVGILKCVCLNCHKTRISRPDKHKVKNMYAFELFKKFKKDCEKITICSYCNHLLPKIIGKEKEMAIFYSFDEKDGEKKKETHLPVSTIYNIFLSLTNQDMEDMGFNLNLDFTIMTKDIELADCKKTHPHQVRPEGFLIKSLLVQPTNTRPWIITKGGKDSDRKDDDLTERLNTIIRSNKEVKKIKSGVNRSGKKKEKTLEQAINILQRNVWTLINNGKTELKTAGRSHKGIVERISGGKQSLIHILGSKRSNMTARTVIIGGGSMIPTGCMGVPEHVANKLPQPELILDYNIDFYNNEMTKGQVICVKRGGITMDVKNNTSNFTKSFTDRAGNIGLKKGDIIERKLRTGDYVVLNRQPTLRIESMQGVKVIIMKDEYGFRIPLGMTPPFGADFDGDEMNIHAVQSVRARIEVENIMATKNHIVSAQNNSVVMGCVQNTLVVMYYLTNTFFTPNVLDEIREDGEYDTMISVEDAYNCYLGADISTERIQNLCKRAKKLYPEYITENNFFKKDIEIPGKLFTSILFPDDFTYERKTGTNEKYPIFKIAQGIIHPKSGPLDKKIIGISGGSTIHELYKNYSPTLAEKLITEAQCLSGYYVIKAGISIGISDCIPKTKEQIDKILQDAYFECHVISQTSKPKEDIEKEINATLNKAMGNAFILAKNGMNKDDRNSLVMLKKCGAKGSDTNNVQISGFVGQQCINGERLNLGLSFFKEDENSLAKRGFICNSYLDGLDPFEHFGHAKSGRVGVISTALGTANAGYMQKKFTKLEEDAKSKENRSVGYSCGTLIEWLYGGDGMDARFLMPIHQIDFPYFFNPTTLSFILNTKAKKQKENRGELRVCDNVELELLYSYLKPSTDNICILEAYRNTCITIGYILKDVKIYECMIPEFFSRIRDLHNEALVAPNHSCGLVAAISIGEPTTQMTLSLFHGAGLAAKDVSVGVPRLTEICNATANPSKTTCTIYLDDRFNKDIKKAFKMIKKKAESNDTSNDKLPPTGDNDIIVKLSEIGNNFVYTTIKDLGAQFDIYYLKNEDGSIPKADPFGFLTFEEYQESWWVKASEDLGLSTKKIDAVSWVVVLTFNVQKLHDNNILLKDIAKEIEDQSFGKNGSALCCVASPQSIGKIEVYTSFESLSKYSETKNKKSNIRDEMENHDYLVIKKIIIKFIEDMPIKGIPGITKIYTRKVKDDEWVIDSQGSNLIKLFNNPLVDSTRTISDNMWEILDTLGIEAVKRFLTEEFIRLLSFDGSYINKRHIDLAVAEMTRTGDITRINRTGISKSRGPLTKIMFEEAIPSLSEASEFGYKDMKDSLSASIMLGVAPNIGSNAVKIKDSSCI